MELMYTMLTYKQKFNKKYGFNKDENHSVKEIAKVTGYKEKGLRKIVEKGEGAFFSNHSSVRPNITNATAWGTARLYSVVMGGNAYKFDKNLLK